MTGIPEAERAPEDPGVAPALAAALPAPEAVSSETPPGLQEDALAVGDGEPASAPEDGDAGASETLAGGEMVERHLVSLRHEVERYRTANEQARQRLVTLEREAEQSNVREQQYEQMLEEKSEQIRQMHLQLQQRPARTEADAPSEEELIALHQELQNEREHIEHDRLAMEDQFRQMEMQMARERAEIARQRSEAQRLQAELTHQLNLLDREGRGEGVQETFQRLREELLTSRNGGRAPSGRPTPPPTGSSPTIPSIDRKAPEGEGGGTSRASTFLGKFFGKRDK